MNEEILSCVAAIKEQASQLGIDLTQMATCGVSAGGTLAMNYAYKNADISAIPVKFVFQLAGHASFEPSDWVAEIDRPYNHRCGFCNHDDRD